MRLGLVGLPNCGKSTLFNALTESSSDTGVHPFSTKDKNVSMAAVYDERLLELEKMYKAKKLVNATIEVVDIPGLVSGASGGAGLGNKFLSHIREVDGIVHVVRCFDDDNVVHTEGHVDPSRDINIVNTELIFADLEVVARRLDKLPKEIQSGKAKKSEQELLVRIMASLEDETPIKQMNLAKEELEAIKHMSLLTLKPLLLCANVPEDALSGNEHSAKVAEYAQGAGIEHFTLCAKMEAELVGMDDKDDFLQELGIAESSLSQLTKAGYKGLNLMSFLTAGEKEVRAWTIPVGTRAQDAAGKVHSDIARGFIRAETVSYATLMEKGSYAACKDAGLVRLEGKEYIVEEGDVILFRFNV